MSREHSSRLGFDLAAVAFGDIDHSGVFEDETSIADDVLGEMQQILPRMELSLALETHGRCDIVGQVGVGHERHIQTGAASGL